MCFSQELIMCILAALSVIGGNEFMFYENNLHRIAGLGLKGSELRNPLLGVPKLDKTVSTN